MRNFIALVCIALVSVCVGVVSNYHIAQSDNPTLVVSDLQLHESPAAFATNDVAISGYGCITLEGLAYTATDYDSGGLIALKADSIDAELILASEAEAVPIHVIEPYWSALSFRDYRQLSPYKLSPEHDYLRQPPSKATV